MASQRAYQKTNLLDSGPASSMHHRCLTVGHVKAYLVARFQIGHRIRREVHSQRHTARHDIDDACLGAVCVTVAGIVCMPCMLTMAVIRGACVICTPAACPALGVEPGGVTSWALTNPQNNTLNNDNKRYVYILLMIYSLIARQKIQARSMRAKMFRQSEIVGKTDGF